MTENQKPVPAPRARRRARTKKSHRAAFVGTALVVLGAAVILALFALEDRVMFFYSPTDVAERGTPVGEDARVGGLVVEGSVLKEGSATVFAVTDLQHSITITYGGILPDLFREGQGIVAEGTFAPTGRFEASRVLAKHDENYMPPEVADALKASGQWKNGPADPSYGDASYGNEGGS